MVHSNITAMVKSAIMQRIGTVSLDRRLCVSTPHGNRSLRLLEACEEADPSDGPFPSADVSSSSSCSAISWRPLRRDLFDALRHRHQWLLLIGDSDMRGLTFSLLQMLAEATHGREVAKANSTL